MRAAHYPLVALSLLGLACTPATPPAEPTTAKPPAQSPPAPSIDPSALPPITERSIVSTVALYLDSTPVECSWGSVGVVAADAPIPYWVIGLVDIHPKIDLDDLSLRDLLLKDDQGRVLGEADREFELRLATTDHDKRDFSRHQTTPLTDPLPAGQTHRLWFRARMSDRFSPERVAPAHYSLILRSGSADASIEGPVGPPWPTG